MGQIRKHTIISSVVIYIGFVLGAFNLLVLFPRYIPVEYMGLTKVIQDYSVLIISIASLGFSAPFYRFNPYFQKYTIAGKNDLFQMYILVIHAGMVIVVIFSYFLRNLVTGYFNVRSPLFSYYYQTTLVFGYLLLLYGVLENYLYSKEEAIIQSVTREIIIRIVIMVIIVSVILGLALKYFVVLFAIHYLIPILILIAYIIKKHPVKLGMSLSTTGRRLIPHMMGMAWLGLVQSIVNAGVPVIDTLVVGGLVGLEGVANYLLSNYIATLVHVPVRATGNILGVRIASFWKENNIDRIQELYRRTSMSYLIYSFFVVSLMLFNMDLFQKVIGKNISINLLVIGILISAKVLELSTGLSNIILGLSKKWKMESAMNILTIVIALPLNIYFVGKWGITGAAVTTLILVLLTSSARLGILYKVYGLFPFNIKSLALLISGILFFILFYFFCLQTDKILIKLLWTGLYSVIFLAFILKFRFSEDLNIIFMNSQKRIKALKEILFSRFS